MEMQVLEIQRNTWKYLFLSPVSQPKGMILIQIPTMLSKGAGYFKWPSSHYLESLRKIMTTWLADVSLWPCL